MLSNLEFAAQRIQIATIPIIFVQDTSAVRSGGPVCGPAPGSGEMFIRKEVYNWDRHSHDAVALKVYVRGVWNRYFRYQSV